MCISNCGLDSVLMNSFINAKTSMKKLQFGPSKCHKMHVGAKTCYCPDLYVDNWEVKVVDDMLTGEKMVVDELIGEHTMELSDTEKYLGDLVSSDGRNEKNIKARSDKGQGIVDQIISIIEGTVFGPFQFEVALIFRSSLLLNGILTNAEAWYGLRTADVEKLEHVDEQLLRKILEVGKGCPKEMLYLETGSLPIRFLIMHKRIMFLHCILNEDQDSLLSRFHLAQWKKPGKNDWTITVKEDLDDLGISLSFDNMKNMKKEKFGDYIKHKIEEKALKYLNAIKAKHSKVLHIVHKSLTLQSYLKPRNVETIQLSKFLFHARTRMLECRSNFSNQYKSDISNAP